MNTKLIDTHCHLAYMIDRESVFPLVEADREKIKHIIGEIDEHGVDVMITIGTNMSSSAGALQIASWFSSVYATVGIHPNDVQECSLRESLDALRCFFSSANRSRIVGIGECGLDFHYPDFNKELQKDFFKAQIEYALVQKIPLVIHSRDAIEETMRLIEPYVHDGLRGVFHCFSESVDYAHAVCSFGFYIGVTCAYTYPKNQTLRDVVSAVGLDHILLETDAPFLPPQLFRGKPNSPKYLALLAHAMAQQKNLSFEEVCLITRANTKTLFGIPL